MCHKNGQRTEKEAFGTKANLEIEVVRDRNPAGNVFSLLYLICGVVLRLAEKYYSYSSLTAVRQREKR
ncbi:hypothetical protein EFN70_09135 [Pediococcus ethanolidurans]|nr:hypothetical protein [Pediococcus ethanolidurans]